jgi:hypothetical protein
MFPITLPEQAPVAAGDSQHRAPGSPKPAFIRVRDVKPTYGFGVSKTYDLARQGKLRIYRGAGRSLLKCSEVEALIESEP